MRNRIFQLIGPATLWFLYATAYGTFAQDEVENTKEEVLLEGLTLRSIGPAAMGGRIDDLAVVESQPWIFYVGTASGGLWKTTNNGTTWKPVFDDQGTSSIGDVTLAPSDPEIVWVGTGEPNNRQSSTFGDGVYKSLDGGNSWEHMGLGDTQAIGRIAIHPLDPDIVYVAAVGHLWGPNEERGVFVTTDGGKKWDKSLSINEDTGAVDLAMDPINPKILYAAAYQRRRVPWGFSGGGPGSGLYKTSDGGKSWNKLSRGLPEGPLGRIGIDIYRSDPRIVYALVQSREGGLFRSEDRGESWVRVNELNPRPIYYSQLRIDPNNSRRIYVLGAPFYVSNDGGRTFQINTDMAPMYDVGVKGDHHALWIDPANGKHLILGGDGGLYISWDASTSWDKVANLPLAQFYSIDVDMREPYYIYAGAQDTHSWGGPSATRNHVGILNGDWFQTNFADGMYQQVDPTNPEIIYSESQGGNIVRLDGRTGDRKTIKPQPGEGETAYRFHWSSPIKVSDHDPKTIYMGGNRLFISNDRGDTWRATPDLTRIEDRDKLPIMGVIPDETTLSRHDGTSSWGTITSVAESPIDADVLYVGTDDGNTQVSRDGGRSWTNLAGRFPNFEDERATVSRVVASSAVPGRAYVSFDRHQLGDFSPHIFITDNYGETWRSIDADIPRVGWVNVIAEHPRNPELLFVGTEIGLFVTLDGGERWTRLTGNFPTVPVDDLVIHPRDNDLVVGTHGRGIYILDDLTPLEQFTAAVRESNVHLFDVRAATEFLPRKHESYGGQREFVGDNPPYGAIISYYLDSEPEETVSLAVLDGDGNQLREVEGSRNAGMNRVVWDLRIGLPEGLQSGRGPLVPPGRYTVRLRTGGQNLENTIEVKLDPRIDVDASELQARYDFLASSNQLRANVHEVVTSLTQIETQISNLLQDRKEEPLEPWQQAATELLDEAKQIRERLAGPSGGRSFTNPSPERLVGRIFREIDGDPVRQGTLHGPTKTQQERLARVARTVEEQILLVNRLIEVSIPVLNRQISEASLPWINAGDPVGRPRRDD